MTFEGASLQGAPPDRISSHGLVQVPEGRSLFDRMTVQDNLLMGAYRRKVAERFGKILSG